MNWNEVETLLDKSAAFTALPINARRTDKSKVSGYESTNGRHLLLERRGSSGVAKMYFEMPFDYESLKLSLDSHFKYYGASDSRAGIDRASIRFGVGAPIACVKVACPEDLKKILARESGA